MDVLENFAIWYMQDPKSLAVPAVSGVHFMDNLSAVTLVRKGNFQVELVLCAPNSEIPDHIHPNVDSFEVYLGGNIMFRHQGKLLIPKEEAEGINWDGLSLRRGTHIRVKPEDYHGATIGKNGGAFLSIQHWLKGNPTTVGHDWAGKTLGPIHEGTL